MKENLTWHRVPFSRDISSLYAYIQKRLRRDLRSLLQVGAIIPEISLLIL